LKKTSAYSYLSLSLSVYIKNKYKKQTSTYSYSLSLSLFLSLSLSLYPKQTSTLPDPLYFPGVSSLFLALVSPLSLVAAALIEPE
jgi:hypothetical protein